MKKFIFALIIISALFTLPSFASEVYDSKDFLVSASSEMMNNSIKNAFDGEVNYLWHSEYTVENGEITDQDKAPFTVDIVFPEPLFVGGIRYTPRQFNQGNSTAGIWQKGEIQGSADGINFEIIGTISSPNDIGTTRETIDFSVKSGTYKAIKITITQSMHDFCSAAEIAVIKNPVAEKLTAGEVYSSKGWKVSASSEFSPNNTIGNAFNDDTKWLWHSAYTAENGTITNQDKPPFTVDIVFPEPLAVGGVRYTPRQLSLDSSTAGIWKKAEFYGSSDGADYEKIGDMSYPNDLPQTRKVTDAFVTPGSYKAIRIVITESNADFATAAEIDVFAPGSGTFVPTVKKNVLEDKNSWSIRANSSQSGPERAIDGNINTYWHSNYKAENGVVVSTDPPPYTLDITFPEDVTISGFTYTPRQDNSSGRFTIAELWVSDTATGELIKIKDHQEGWSFLFCCVLSIY